MRQMCSIMAIGIVVWIFWPLIGQLHTAVQAVEIPREILAVGAFVVPLIVFLIIMVISADKEEVGRR